MSNRRLAEARQEINEEVERRTHTPPKFSKDGKIAVLKIESKAQVHPVIATRWVGCYSRYLYHSVQHTPKKQNNTYRLGNPGKPSPIKGPRDRHGG